MTPRSRYLTRITHTAALLAVLASAGSRADPPNMRFSGYLIAPPPCTVSDRGGRIEVVFKRNINTSKIDGDNYKQTVPYQIDCPGMNRPGMTWRMKLKVVGTPTEFEAAAVQSSVPDLGIKLILNKDTDFVLNTAQEIKLDASQSPPMLEAVPVKLSGSRLPLTEFTASALLIAELY
ncbi:fimbrial protein [Achromobacter marplatensis]|jgi:type 1 fimbria pilin|uniref:fimbrial protein n=1 Tax=Achromobacter marplatensis TaxID=470868 RepID=UPI0028E6F784|nr:fimbrial protein [Achromobacter marplatensis]